LIRALNQHRIALERVQLFLESQNVVHIREMTVDHLETFKTVGLPKKMRVTTKATTFAKIRCFLRAAFRRGWIKEALVDKVTAVKAVYDQKEPYSDEDIAAIFDHASQLDGRTHGYAKQPQTFRLLLELNARDWDARLRRGHAPARRNGASSHQYRQLLRSAPGGAVL